MLSIERLLFDDRAIAYDIDGNAGKAYRLYQAAFDRLPDQDGAIFWNSKLHDGVGRSEVLMAFSESPENQAALIGKIGNGISYHLYG